MIWKYAFGVIAIATGVMIAIEANSVYFLAIGGVGAYYLLQKGEEAHQRYKVIPQKIMELLNGAPIQPPKRYSFEESIRHLDAAISASRERTLGHLARHPELKVIYP